MPAKQPDKKYTTPEAAEVTGIPEGTIRSWMSRHPGKFIENLHFVIEPDGRKLWTSTGVEFLKTRPISATEDASPEADTLIETLLDDAANYYAQRFWQELPTRVVRRIQQMRTNPTEAEKTLIEQSTQNALSIGTFSLLPNYMRLSDGES